MKALKEIGLRKALRYGYLSPLNILMRACPYPQLRALFLRLLGAKIGKNTIIENISFMNFYYDGFSNLKIGKNCFIGTDVLIDLAGKVKVEENSTIAARAIILTHTNVGYKDHPLRKKFPKRIQRATIERGAFIGAGSIIMPGISIGEKAFVGAGSVVTKDVKPKKIVYGNPARGKD